MIQMAHAYRGSMLTKFIRQKITVWTHIDKQLRLFPISEFEPSAFNVTLLTLDDLEHTS